MTGFININKSLSGNENFWHLNSHMIYVEPFSDLYNQDKSKNKEESSKVMWCITWMEDPDEEVNKYYRIPKDERLLICQKYHKDYDPEHPLIKECLEKYPHLCLDADQLAYKLQKDQLIEISQFLSRQEITLDTVKDIIDLKARMPKIYQDFDKVSKLFEKNKADQRIFGGRKQTARERNLIQPDDE